MKIAITDACIFIDLHELDLTSDFFSLDLEIHTSVDVYNELHNQHRQQLNQFVLISKLTIHKISEAERLSILQFAFPRSLSDTDKTVLFLAEKLGAFVLSSDKTVRNCAKSHCIKTHGMFWILDCMVENQILTKSKATTVLKSLILSNPFYQNNSEMVAEMEARLKTWVI